MKTRKECYDFIKSHGLQEEFNVIARAEKNTSCSYTNLSTERLNALIEDKCKSKTKKLKEVSCTDSGARRAIKAIAAYLGLNNIEKNF